MAWRITWRRDGRKRTFGLMRPEVQIWTDESGQLLLEAPPDGWIWATLQEDEEQGPLLQWHDSPEGIELVRGGEPIDHPSDQRDWSMESGDVLRGKAGETSLEIKITAGGPAAEQQFIDRSSAGYPVESDTQEVMWNLHRDLSMGDGWQRLLAEIAQLSRRWPGVEKIEGCAVLIWRGNGEFYHRVVWLDDHQGEQEQREDGPRRPDALASLLARQPELKEALRQHRQVVVRRRDEETVDVLLPMADDGFEGALYLVGEPGEEFDAESSWKLADLFNPAAIQLVRRYRQDQQRRSLEEENRYFRDRERRHYLFKDLVCESEVMRNVYDALSERVDDDDPIWLAGEAGTGKELLARAAHHLGDRQDAMLIRMGCADFPRELVDFELFGCVASELTGAVAARKGIFELAEGGTVFLDEVDRLSPMVQGKLARVLKEKEVRRVGDAVGRPVDARLIASSHRDLQKLCDEGRFRPDLYELLEPHRLNVPPLRRRRADIPALARIFVKKFARRYEAESRVLDERLKEWLLRYEWPGNVRQLQTVMEAAVLAASDREEIRFEDLVVEEISDIE